MAGWLGLSRGVQILHVLQWQELVMAFREGMPRQKRRSRVKTRGQEETFTGAQAAQWLHRHLQSAGNFGTVSRQQVQGSVYPATAIASAASGHSAVVCFVWNCRNVI